MAHARTQIRNAVAALLTGLPTTADRVHVNRRRPVPGGSLQPTLLIRTGEDVADDEPVVIGSPRLIHRHLQVIVEAVARDAAVDDLLDQVSLEVEQALAADLSLGGRVVALSPWTVTRAEEDDDDKLGGMAISFTAEYRIYENAPDVLVR